MPTRSCEVAHLTTISKSNMNRATAQQQHGHRQRHSTAHTALRTQHCAHTASANKTQPTAEPDTGSGSSSNGNALKHAYRGTQTRTHNNRIRVGNGTKRWFGHGLRVCALQNGSETVCVMPALRHARTMKTNRQKIVLLGSKIGDGLCFCCFWFAFFVTVRCRFCLEWVSSRFRWVGGRSEVGLRLGLEVATWRCLICLVAKLLFRNWDQRKGQHRRTDRRRAEHSWFWWGNQCRNRCVGRPFRFLVLCFGLPESPVVALVPVSRQLCCHWYLHHVCVVCAAGSGQEPSSSSLAPLRVVIRHASEHFPQTALPCACYTCPTL